jgi:hypothetical protein
MDVILVLQSGLLLGELTHCLLSDSIKKHYQTNALPPAVWHRRGQNENEV